MPTSCTVTCEDGTKHTVSADRIDLAASSPFVSFWLDEDLVLAVAANAVTSIVQDDIYAALAAELAQAVRQRDKATVYEAVRKALAEL